MPAATQSRNYGAIVKYHHLYADENGESHFKNVNVEFVEELFMGNLSAPVPVKNLIFREVMPSYDLDWHNAPRRQFIVNLTGGVRITASDGEEREIGPGEILLVEDTTGKGHLSQALDGKMRTCLFVTLE